MAVPVCPDCGATIQPSWDWCHACGFDPESLKPAGWQVDDVEVAAPAPSARLDERRGPAPEVPSRPAPESPPTSLRPHDLLRPRAVASTPEPLTGPLVAPEPDVDHRPLTLDDLRRSTSSSKPSPAAASPSVAAVDAASPPTRDRFASVADKVRPPRPSDLGAPSPAKVADDRPPLFPAPPTTPATPAAEEDPAPAIDVPQPQPLAPPPSGGALDEQHPYLDLPYDDPSPAPGSEPEPEQPTSRLRRRRQDDRPNAATMAMAAGRMPSDPVDAPTRSSTLPPPPAPAPPGASVTPAAASTSAGAEPPAAVERPTSPADSSSLGPIVFGATSSPVATITKPPKAKSSPLSVAAILMTIAIAVVVLWPTYKSLVDSESGPALPPPSAGVIGFAPADADGARAPVDPKKTASWETSAPPNGGFEVDMPGVVIVRTPTIPLNGDSGSGVVASSSSGRGGYVVAAIDPAAGKTFSSQQQAADAILVGFNGTTGNDLKAGAATTLGGVPAIAVEGTVDGVPSKGAIGLVGNRAFLAVAGNVPDADLDRFLASFRVSDAAPTATTAIP
jgi:hypothetical protein